MADAILQARPHDLAALLHAGAIGDIAWSRLDAGLHAPGTGQAARERPRGTPTPFGSTLLLHRTAWLFCLLPPFGLAGMPGIGIPLPCTLPFPRLLRARCAGRPAATPFRSRNNTVPLDVHVRRVEIAVLRTEGAPIPPEPVEPRHFVLSGKSDPDHRTGRIPPDAPDPSFHVRPVRIDPGPELYLPIVDIALDYS